MTENNRTKSKKRTSDTRPRLDAVIRHIAKGSYDEEWGQLKGAMEDRQRKRQEAVLGMVKEVFGDEYLIERQGTSQTFTFPASPLRVDGITHTGGAMGTGTPPPPDPEIVEAEKRALEQEQELHKQAGDALGGDDNEVGIESRSPQIGSLQDPPQWTPDFGLHSRDSSEDESE